MQWKTNAVFIVTADVHLLSKRQELCDILSYQSGAVDYSSVMG